ncbi:MAG: hypothetical protein KKD18_02890 [Nanoarchaeota archaeon]|nr:hypothetical protein [Nanoarchaeota archaeon]MBU0977336.1 hypothetical protein [Nanoarchaeota archaeon]
MTSKFYYDADADDMIISNKLNDERVKKNYLFDDFVISVTGSGKIVGLEIRNVSNFLKDSGLDADTLKSIKEVELTIVPRRDFIAIYVSLSVLHGGNLVIRRIPITHIPSEIAVNN